MDGIRKFGNWLWNHLGNLALLGGWIVSAGFFPTIPALTQGATPLTYAIGAVTGLFLFFAMRAYGWELV